MGRQPEQEGETMKTTYIDAIKAASNHVELDDIVEAYLAEIGEADRARGETYAETSARLGGDEILEAAEARWFEIEG